MLPTSFRSFIFISGHPHKDIHDTLPSSTATICMLIVREYTVFQQQTLKDLGEHILHMLSIFAMLAVHG